MLTTEISTWYSETHDALSPSKVRTGRSEITSIPQLCPADASASQRNCILTLSGEEPRADMTP
eukprot:6953889-Prorocentrum_lima.AAC.1